MYKSEILEKSQNKEFSWSNSLSIEKNKIIYLEHLFVHENELEIENLIEISDTNEDELLYPLIKNYLKSLNNNKIENLEKILIKNNIKFKKIFWSTYSD